MNDKELLLWIIENLLTEEQKQVVPPGRKVSLKELAIIKRTITRHMEVLQKLKSR